MNVIALFQGAPKTYLWEGNEIKTSFFKDSVNVLKSANQTLIGNEQANPKHHGGPFKEVYSYPREAYDYWGRVLSRQGVEAGLLGENITTALLDESQVLLGDRFQFGTMILEAAQPRMPCFKLDLRLKRADGMKLFLEAPAAGIYWKILQDGEIHLGDRITRTERKDFVPRIPLRALLLLMKNEAVEPELLLSIAEFPGIDPKLADCARSRI